MHLLFCIYLQKSRIVKHLIGTISISINVTFIISPLVYFLLAIGVALSLLLLWYGWIILGASLVLLVIMVKIIDPKLKAISEDYEIKQKKYLEDLEKIARWEE